MVPLAGTLLSLDGILYAQSVNDVVLLSLVFVSIAIVVIPFAFARRSNPSPLKPVKHSEKKTGIHPTKNLVDEVPAQ